MLNFSSIYVGSQTLAVVYRRNCTVWLRWEVRFWTRSRVSDWLQSFTSRSLSKLYLQQSACISSV